MAGVTARWKNINMKLIMYVKSLELIYGWLPPHVPAILICLWCSVNVDGLTYMYSCYMNAANIWETPEVTVEGLSIFIFLVT